MGRGYTNPPASFDLRQRIKQRNKHDSKIDKLDLLLPLPEPMRCLPLQGRWESLLTKQKKSMLKKLVRGYQFIKSVKGRDGLRDPHWLSALVNDRDRNSRFRWGVCAL